MFDYIVKDVDVFFVDVDDVGVGEVVCIEFGDMVKIGVLFLVDVDDKCVVGKVVKMMIVEEIVVVLNLVVEVV